MPHSSSTALSRSQRIVSGLAILLVVDLIWVASSEFTEYIFHNLKYDKPYFSTYFKTSLFMVYLVGFLIHRPWREQLVHLNQVQLARQHYQPVEEESDNPNEEDTEAESPSDDPQPSTSRSSLAESSNERHLSSPTWIPANIPESGKSSGTESETESLNSSRSRRVRFKREAQVVEMNPADALYANLARLSYNAHLRAQSALQRAASRLTITEVAHLAVIFCIPWFMGNYCYQLALSDTEAAVVNVLSSTSCLFTLLLAAIFPSEESDRFTLSKFLAILFNMVGVCLVSYSDLDVEGGFPKGALWTLVGAFFYATYIVLLRRKVNHEDNMDSPMFFGFVGIFNSLILWPGLAVAHFTKSEPFEWPSSQQLQFLVLNGLIGTVLSELLWLWGCFYTSSLVATLAISLTIPLTILADIFMKGKDYGLIFFVGAVPMFMSFFIVALLTHYQNWDPVLDMFKHLLSRCRRPRSNTDRNAYVFDRQADTESEALINESDSSHNQQLPFN